MRILVVEDSAKMSALLRKGLERGGYVVDVVNNGTDAVWIASESDYDAIVLDVILDESGALADGFEVCRMLRQNGCWAPVLMVTARDAIEDRVSGLDAGADDYLPKPFSFEELVARLRALMRRGAPERPAVLSVDDLRRSAHHPQRADEPSNGRGARERDGVDPAFLQRRASFGGERSGHPRAVGVDPRRRPSLRGERGLEPFRRDVGAQAEHATPSPWERASQRGGRERRGLQVGGTV